MGREKKRKARLARAREAERRRDEAATGRAGGRRRARILERQRRIRARQLGRSGASARRRAADSEREGLLFVGRAAGDMPPAPRNFKTDACREAAAHRAAALSVTAMLNDPEHTPPDGGAMNYLELPALVVV